MFGFKKELYTPEYQLAGDDRDVEGHHQGQV